MSTQIAQPTSSAELGLEDHQPAIDRIRDKWDHLGYNPVWKDDGFTLLDIADKLAFENKALAEAVAANNPKGRMDLVFRALLAEGELARIPGAAGTVMMTEWGVALDENGSVDLYPTREEAVRQMHGRAGTRLVRVTTETVEGSA